MPDSSAEDRARIDVAFPRQRDIASWQRRHAAGEVPSAWPYGLSGLVRHAEVAAVAVDEPGRVARGLHRLAGITPTARPAGAGRRVIGLSWDENTARALALTAPRPEMHAGVIWLTDRMRRMDAAERARAARLFRRFDGLFVTSSGQLDALAELLGPDGPPVDFTPFGVDSGFFSARPYPERPLLVSIGGDRDRDATTLYAALERVAARHPGLEILIQSASSSPPPGGVTVVPRVSHRELAELYARATVVVVATRDNLHVSGLTVSLESLATARPVVITETPGMRDYLNDGRVALLGRVGDADSLADRVSLLLDDPDRAAEMGRAGRRLIEERFTTGHLVDGLARVLRLGRG